MAYKDFSANQNPWIKEITEKNRLHLRKLAGMDNLNSSQEEETMSEKIRWYAHGDAVEGHPDLYYCASCDYFKPEEHFEEHANTIWIRPGLKRLLNNSDKYKSSMRTWKQKYSKLSNYVRPSNPDNLFA